MDVALAQVLIEAVVFELTAPDSWSIGRSHAADAPLSLKALTNAGSVATAWYISNVTSTSPPHRKDLLALEATLAGNLDSVVGALASVPGIRILQRPRIQTSVGLPATMFLEVGPSLYPTNGAYYGAAYCGCHAAIQMLHASVTLKVTCFLAPDGTVLTDVRQQIDKLAGTVTIQNAGDVPVTTNYTAQTHLAVRDRDILVLGGFVENSRESIFSPVSFLDRVPVAGDWLNKIITYPTRKIPRELVVLLRPVLLPPAQVASSL